MDLIADILKRYGWGVDRVTKHQDYNGKYCPHRTLDAGWDRFIKMIEAKMNTKLYRVQVGAFSNRSNADKLVAELKSKGYSAFIKTE